MGTDSDAFVRTTVSLREDLYQRLKRRGSISDALNEILAREFQRDHRLFGSLKGIGTDDLRDHEDRV